MGFLLLLCSCSSKKYLSEGEYLLDKVSVTTDTTRVNVDMLSGYVRQQPNTRWISMVKLPLGIYLMSNPNSNSSFNRFLRKMGEAPVVYDTLLSERSRQRIHDALFNLGYLPGSGRKNITTMRETTMPAVIAALELLSDDGILMVAIYPGHEEGDLEGKMLADYFATLDRRKVCASMFKIVNSPTSPYFYIIEKK